MSRDKGKSAKKRSRDRVRRGKGMVNICPASQRGGMETTIKCGRKKGLSRFEKSEKEKKGVFCKDLDPWKICAIKEEPDHRGMRSASREKYNKTVIERKFKRIACQT